MNRIISLLLTLFALGTSAQITLFHTGDETGCPYRIPAITTTACGDIIALSDNRPCGRDIGYGRVDIMARISPDHGLTWREAETVLQGSGTGADSGYGDACLVADRERDELLLVCVSGDVPYWESTPAHPQRMVSIRATKDKKRGWQWHREAMIDHTDAVFHGLFGDRINGLFMGSGRICQSRQVKVGKYYRLYAALCTHKGNYVLYSDNFGDSWDVLGSATESCAPQGDEPKCEELPDGSVLLSSRKDGGRWFNIFRFTDVRRAKGVWGHPVDSRTVEGGISNIGTPCNGEILIVPAVRREDGVRTLVALQSIPAGPQRSHVTIYYKELASRADYLTPRAFASGWQGSYEVTPKLSAYSTMTLQQDGRIGFLYEEEPGDYQIIYRRLDLMDVTDDAYKIDPACVTAKQRQISPYLK